MIGEIRDDETARIAVRSAITGHLVVSTIHTNNALNTIERLLDMDIERYLLGTAISGIISQRLAKKLCPKCRGSRPATDYEKLVIKKAINIDIDNLYTPVGCSECLGGYRGRIPVHEVLEVDQDIKDAITNNTPKEKLRKMVYGDNKTISLLQDGLKKVVNGLTSFEEIIRIIDIETDFGEGDEELRMALMGKMPIPHDEDNEKEETIITEDKNETTKENNEVITKNESIPENKEPTQQIIMENGEAYDIPTDDQLSFNQGAFNNISTDFNYDDYDIDDDDDDDDY